MENIIMIADVPHMVEQWDFGKNSENIALIPAKRSKVNYHWRCKKCGYEWETAPITRYNSTGECPCCELNKVTVQNINDLLTIHPEADETYDYDKNSDVDIFSLNNYSREQVWWNCKNCGYAWFASVRTRVRANFRCPCCETNKVIRKGVNDVLTRVPELIKWYDFEKNKGIDIHSLGVDSTEIAHWKCPECGRSWQTSIKARIRRKCGSYSVIPCPHYETAKRKPEDIAVVSGLPDVLKFWDFEKNTLDPDVTPSNSSKKAHWRCPHCKYEWEGMIFSRTRSTHKCPCCELNTVVVPKINDIFTVVPDAANSYDYEKNTDIDHTCLGVGSIVPVWWKCQKCGHQWKTPVSSRIKRTSDGYSLRSCQKCYWTDPSRIRSVSTIPRLMHYWDHTKNSSLNLDPSLVSIHAQTVAWWKCEKCGHSWSAKIKSRFQRSDGCPRCASCHAIVKGKNDILTIVPDFASIFDFEQNSTLDIYSTGPQSRAIAHFSCKKCGHNWSSPIRSTLRKENGVFQFIGCPNCSIKVPKGASFAEQYPELLLLFNEERNNCTLASITVTDARKVQYWWVCKVCNNSFQSKVYSMIRAIDTKIKQCPFCTKKDRLIKNSFASYHPELLQEYSPENHLDPYEVFFHNKTNVTWICRKDPTHKWEASFALRHTGGGKCPICYRTRLLPGINTFADVYKDYVHMWSPNNEREPQDIFYNSSLRFKWICPKCNVEFSAHIKSVVSSQEPCPYCNNRRVLPGTNSLADCYPDIVKYWSPNNERNASSVLSGSKIHVKWICPECHGEYPALIADMVSGEADCPYCNDRQVLPGFNSLAKRYPNVAELWSSCNERSADIVLPRSKSQAKWICPDCRGEYSALIVDMVSGEATCPYCNDRQVLPGFNSFAVRHDDLLQEWDMVNNHLVADPDQIGERCQTPVWWICSKNLTHEYMMPPARRLLFQKRHRESCPYCKGLRRKKRHFV